MARSAYTKYESRGHCKPPLIGTPGIVTWLSALGLFLVWPPTGTLADTPIKAATGDRLGVPWKYPTEVREIACSPDSRWVLVRTIRTVHLRALDSGEAVGPDIGIDGSEIKSMAFGDEGRTLLVGYIDRRRKTRNVWIQPWDPDGRRFTGDAQTIPHATGEIAALPDGRVASVHDISPDGTWYSRSDDGVQLWQLPKAHSILRDDRTFAILPRRDTDLPALAIVSPDSATICPNVSYDTRRALFVPKTAEITRTEASMNDSETGQPNTRVDPPKRRTRRNEKAELVTMVAEMLLIAAVAYALDGLTGGNHFVALGAMGIAIHISCQHFKHLRAEIRSLKAVARRRGRTIKRVSAVRTPAGESSAW